MAELIFIGTIVGIKGLDGTLKVETQDEYEIENGNKILIGYSQKFLNEYLVKNWKTNFKNLAFVKLYGVNSAQQGRSLVEKGIFINLNALKKSSKEFELNHLTGYTVVDVETGSKLGEVIGTHPNPGNDLLVAIIDEKEVLIPMVNEFIIKVDRGKKFVFIKSIEGLFDINL